MKEQKEAKKRFSGLLLKNVCRVAGTLRVTSGTKSRWR
jgi:hypothetical protein